MHFANDDEAATLMGFLYENQNFPGQSPITPSDIAKKLMWAEEVVSSVIDYCRHKGWVQQSGKGFILSPVGTAAIEDAYFKAPATQKMCGHLRFKLLFNDTTKGKMLGNAESTCEQKLNDSTANEKIYNFMESNEITPGLYQEGQTHCNFRDKNHDQAQCPFYV